MISQVEYAKRRQQLMKTIGADSALVLFAAPECIRNNDCHYYYRQHSDFYYLTGFEEPEAVLVLLPNKKSGEMILFNRPRHRDQEIWEGKRAGQDGAKKHFGANQAFDIAELEKKLPELLAGRRSLHYTLGANKAHDKIVISTIRKLQGKIRNGLESPLQITDVTQTLHEMRLIKSPAEIALMRKAAHISAKAHTRAMQYCQPGMHEYELEAELLHEFNRHGARFVAYTSIVGSGANSCTLHYNTNNHIIKKNDLVLIDAGCEYHNYASDITRTFPASGKFSEEQKAIYEIVLAAQLAAIKTIRPGKYFHEAQQAIVKIITQGLVDLGLLKGSVSELIKKEAYLPFYMHKSGHWLGLDVHDVGRYKINNEWRKLKSGMVLTVEPGIYISEDLKVPARWKNIGVRIEDDLLVTNKGHEILSAAAPKTVKDIEAVMNG